MESSAKKKKKLLTLFSLSSLNVKMLMILFFYNLKFGQKVLFFSPNSPYGFSQRGTGSSSIEIKAIFYIICNAI